MTRNRAFRTLLAIAGLVLATIAPAFAGGYKAGDLTIDQLWARPSIGSIPNSAAYMTIANAGVGAEVLEAAATPAAATAEFHTHERDGDVMKMRRVEGGVTIAPKGSTEFKPGGLHVMLIGLTRPLKEGDTFPLTLRFKQAGDVIVEVTVAKAGPAKAHKH